MIVRLYTGFMRQGKTANAIYDIVYGHMIYGRRIITNTPIWCEIKGRRVEADFYEDYDRFKFEFMRAKGALIFVDESSLFFSSLHWNNLGLDYFSKFRQAGKESCDLYGTTQAYVDTVASLRRVTSEYCVCKKSYWLIPFPFDFRRDVYNKKWGFYERKGPFIHTPMIYKMLRVSPGWFTSQAQLAENRERYIYGQRTLYPSQFRRAASCYDHEYLIKGSAVKKHGGGNLENYYGYASWEVYRDKLESKKRTSNESPASPETGPAGGEVTSGSPN